MRAPAAFALVTALVTALAAALAAPRSGGALADDSASGPARPPAKDAPADRPASGESGRARAAAPAVELADEKAERRARAASLAGPDTVLLVLSPPAADGFPGTGRNADFEYLSPLAPREGAIVVAGAAPGAKDAADDLYLPVRNPAAERWTGAEPGPGPDTAAAARFRRARATDQLADDLVALLRTRTTLRISAGPPAAAGPVLAKLLAAVETAMPGRVLRFEGASADRGDELSEALRGRRAAAAPAEPGAKPTDAPPPLDVRSARRPLTEMREVKSASEVERIRRAVAATVAGHADLLRAARPGMFEYELQAILEMRCRAGGCRRQAYPSIVGSGPNSCILHYDRNARALAAGDLVVVDAGGEADGYACDVTRTFPASGRFTAEQAKVYDAVLEAQEAAIAAVKPGVTLRQVHEVARGVLERHGLAKWFIHGTCHAVGLEVHDAWRGDAVLRPGCVITVEPGVYDASRDLGVRIEDTILVTSDGCEVLSRALPKERAAVESLMREPAPAGLPR